MPVTVMSAWIHVVEELKRNGLTRIGGRIFFQHNYLDNDNTRREGWETKQAVLLWAHVYSM